MIYGLNEIQSAELILLILISAIVFGTFMGLLVRSLPSLFYKQNSRALGRGLK